eukprot:TRINITY_DN46142_c0_g1_i1.p1 TRINITY_DN46142_c0_g1~~TRINITY_DN46142_c0_g1_i1.p1  ORF type:complete len:433 (-),score=79.73 TRINITY_DN46142_c0_g1_i1:498-1796(-)
MLSKILVGTLLFCFARSAVVNHDAVEADITEGGFTTLLQVNVDWKAQLGALKKRAGVVANRTQVGGTAMLAYSHYMGFSVEHGLQGTKGSWGLYAFCVLSMCGLITAIYLRRGIVVVVSIIAYVLALSWMSTLVKSIYVDFDFPYPQFLTSTHFFLTTTVGFTVLFCKSRRDGSPIFVPTFAHLFKGIVPQAFAMALSIGFSNKGILLANAHLYEMMGAMSLIVTTLLGTLMGKPLAFQLIMPLLLITVGLLVVSFGEVHFSALGAMFIFFGVLMRALKVQIQGILLSGNAQFPRMAPMELVAWNSLSSFTIMAIWSLCAEGVTPSRVLLEKHDRNLYFSIWICAFAACVLNTAALFVLSELGPVAQQAVGQLKGALACLTAAVALGEVMSTQQICGYAVIISAISWYNSIDQRLKAEAAQKAEVTSKQEKK